MSDLKKPCKLVLHQIRSRLSSLFLLLTVLSSTTVNPSTLVVLSSGSQSYQSVLEAISEEHQDIQATTLESVSEDKINKSKFLIGIGSTASKHLFNHLSPNQHLIASFILRADYQQIFTQESLSVAAVFIDQSYLRQLRLIKIIDPNIHTIGIALGPRSQNQRAHLEKAGEQLDLNLQIEVITDLNTTTNKISHLLEVSDAFLAIPDGEIMNRTNAKWLLYTSLKYRVPLFAFSESFVRAGALAAIYKKPYTIGKETSHKLKELKKNKKIFYKNDFEIKINQSVSKIFYHKKIDVEKIKEALIYMEGDNEKN